MTTLAQNRPAPKVAEKEAFVNFVKDQTVFVLVTGIKNARQEMNRTEKIVQGYLGPVLEKADLRDDKGVKITSVRETWRCEDEAKLLAYWEKSEKLHKENGFALPDGHCPILVAQQALRKAEKALIDRAASTLMNIDGDRLFGEKRQKFLDLIERAATELNKSVTSLVA